MKPARCSIGITPDLFPGTKPARARPRKLMHFWDVGYIDGVGTAAVFRCRRCGHETDWTPATDTEIRRGVPCPNCNAPAVPNPVTTGLDRTTSGAIGMP